MRKKSEAKTESGKKVGEKKDITSFPPELLLSYKSAFKQSQQLYDPPQTLWPGHIWVWKNFLTLQECQAWINFAESGACQLEHMQQRGTRYLAARECFRFHLDDVTMSHRLFERLAHSTSILDFLPQFPGEEPVTFNPNIRLYKYEKNMLFAKHVDDSNVVAGGVTRMTVLIYLSNCQGGATRFFGLHNGNARTIGFEPNAGAMLLHVHGNLCLEHQADPVVSGIKWVLRTDLVYRKK